MHRSTQVMLPQMAQSACVEHVAIPKVFLNWIVLLQTLSTAGYVLGLVTAGFLGASALLAVLFGLATCCGRSRSLACIALPFS